MELILCKRCGRYYKPTYPSCPECSKRDAGEDGEIDVTMPFGAGNGTAQMEDFMPGGKGGSKKIDETFGANPYDDDPGTVYSNTYSSMKQEATSGFIPADAVTEPEEDDRTVSVYSIRSNFAAENAQPGEWDGSPAVGWLICLSGKYLGRDFRLHAGKNYVGRSEKMDVVLKGMMTVSRDRHVTVLFEPKKKIYIVQPGESKELAYLNEQLILQPKLLKQGDIITVGDVDLMFQPLCSADGFDWSKYIPEYKK